MPKKQNPSDPLPLYSTFPTQVDRISRNGRTEPDIEDVERLRDWGQQSKL